MGWRTEQAELAGLENGSGSGEGQERRPRALRVRLAWGRHQGGAEVQGLPGLPGGRAPHWALKMAEHLEDSAL